MSKGDFTPETSKAARAKQRRLTPIRLKMELIEGFMGEYAVSGMAAWKILAKENPEAFLRIGAYLAPREIDIFTSNTSDEELDGMIALLRAYLKGTIDGPASVPMIELKNVAVA